MKLTSVQLTSVNLIEEKFETAVSLHGEAGRDNRRDQATIVISSQIYCYVNMKPGRFSSRPIQAGSRLSRENIFRINTYPEIKNVPPCLLKILKN